MLPSRESNRLSGYDYSQPGAYFVTINSFGLKHIFGSIDNGLHRLTPLSLLIADQWRELPAHYSNLSLDAWVVMPNHLHGLLLLHKPPVQHEKTAANLSTAIGGYKAGVTRTARAMGIYLQTIWHGRFYDHVIRHERAFKRVQEYIVNNPRQWSLDRENPERTALNGFYAWIEQYSRHTAPETQKP